MQFTSAGVVKVLAILAGTDPMVPFINMMTLPRGKSFISLNVPSKVYHRIRLSRSPALAQGWSGSKL